MFYYFVDSVLFLSALVIVITLVHFLLTGNTPPLVTPNHTRKNFWKLLTLMKNSVFYDIGCGNGGLLINVSERFPETKCVGIESSIILYTISKVRVFLLRRENIEIKSGDFLNEDISDATHLYMWIFVRDMDRLLEKFSAELKKGAKVYSLGFTFTDKKPKEIVKVGKGKDFARTIYVYEF